MGGRQRRQRRALTDEQADLLSPVTVAHAPWLPPISASLARDVAGRHTEPDDRTQAQRSAHARSSKRKAAETARRNGAAMFNDLGLAG